MSLFGSKKKIETVADASVKNADVKKVSAAKVAKKVAKTAIKTPKAEKAVAVVVNGSVSANSFNNSSVVLRPRITEKSGVLSQGGVYTFEVTRGANKNSVKSAIKSLYKVSPIKVAILNNPAKNVFVRGRRGVVPGVRKAVVTLKKGDKIDFV